MQVDGAPPLELPPFELPPFELPPFELPLLDVPEPPELLPAPLEPPELPKVSPPPSTVLEEPPQAEMVNRVDSDTSTAQRPRGDLREGMTRYPLLESGGGLGHPRR
jgi:hypothetical protein